MDIPFYFAHFSDLHFSNSPNRQGFIDALGVSVKLRTRLTWTFLRRSRSRLLGTFNVNAAQILSEQLSQGYLGGIQEYDGYIATGDLATAGCIEDLEIANRFFRGQLLFDATNQKKSYTTSFRFPLDALALLPGNHDRYHGQFCSPGSPYFEDEAAFNHHWRLTPAKRCPLERVQSFTFSKGQTSLTILAADFSLKKSGIINNPLRYLGRGRVDDDVLELLTTKTRNLKEKSAIIWAVHFPPAFGPLSYFQRLRFHFHKLEGEDRLLEAAATANVRYILAGHTHISSVYECLADTSRKTVTVICSGSPICSNTTVPSFQDLEIVIRGNDVIRINATTLDLKEYTNLKTKETLRRYTRRL